MMLESSILEKNFSIFKKKLLEVCPEVNLDALSSFEEQIKNASYSITPNSNDCYVGSLLQIVLRTFIPFALKINDTLQDELKVETTSIIKVGLLSHISKCVMFEKNKNEWEIEKLGKLFTYSNSETGMKMGMRSIYIASKLNITFTESEFEAMMIMDREDKQSEFYSSTLSIIIKQANQLTQLQNRFIK